MARRGQGRGRAPCCEKEGLKRGPWTQAEDQKLIAHIMKHGHRNWRNLPKQAGLLRCGKSCRLRWVNYLRPDVKRGSFTEEEEENIIKLHTQLGNKWSKIASFLPGRTDNEIKNMWHTHIKKRLACREENCSPSAEEAPKQESCEAMPQQNMVSSDYYSTEKKSTSDQEEAWRDGFSEGMMDFVVFPEIWSIGEELGGGYNNLGGQEVLVNQWLVYLEKEIDLWQ